MPQIEYIFCEGIAGSLDRQLLEKVLEGLSEGTNTPRIVPSGGKGNLSNFMLGYLERGGVGTRSIDSAIGFRDRDFDYQVPNEESIIRDGRFLITFRTTIENYLLNPRLLFEYIQFKGLPSHKSRITTIAEAEEIFKESARHLRFYNAARWAHGTVKKQNSETFKLNSGWPKNSGDLPEDYSDTGCRVIMTDVVGNIKSKAERLTFDIFESSYTGFISKFDDLFISDHEKCLCWYNGKDLATMLFRLLPPANSFFRNGKGDYYDFALERLGTEDFPLPPDLIELRNILNGTSSL